MSAKVMIWSDVHNAWWRPDACGHTADRCQAGLFDEAEADRAGTRRGRGSADFDEPGADG